MQMSRKSFTVGLVEDTENRISPVICETFDMVAHHSLRKNEQHTTIYQAELDNCAAASTPVREPQQRLHQYPLPFFGGKSLIGCAHK